MYKKVIAGIYIVGIFIMGMNVYTNYKKYDTNYKITNMQLLGLQELDLLYKINISLKTYRGLKQFKNQSQKEIEEEFLHISYLLSKITDKKLEKEIRRLWKADQFYAFNNTINKIELKILKIGETYGLFENLSKTDYHIISSIVYTLPQLVELIGSLREKGSYYISHQKANETEKFLLNSIFEEFKLYQKTLKLTDKESQSSSLNLTRVQQYLEKFSKNQFDINSLVYFNDLTLLVKDLNNYYVTSEEKIVKNLTEYKQKLNNSIMKSIYLFIALFILFSIILYFVYSMLDKFFINKKQERYISTIENELYGKLEFCDNVKEVSKECIQFLCKKIDAVNGLLYIVDTKNKKLSLSSTYNISPRHANHILDFDEGVFSEVLENKEIQLIHSSEKREVDFGSFKTDFVQIVTIPIVTEYNNVIAIAQLALLSQEDHYRKLKKVYEIMANNLLKSQKNEENKKYFNLIDKYVITSTTNKDGVINYASKAFQDISGYSQNQLIGMSHNLLKHPDVDISIYKDMWDTITAGKIWIKEFQNRKKDGSTYWVESTISPEFGFYGDIVGYTAIRQDVTDRKRVEELSITDALTSLYNRRHFDKELSKDMALTQRMGTKLVFAMIDIDHFKQYNDTYGHQEGDVTLKAVARTLKELFKRDIDKVFRLGGEEFGILFFVKEFEDSTLVGDKIIQSIEALQIEHTKSSASHFVTISMGMFIYHNSQLTSTEVYRETDELLYKAKQNGRNQYFSNLKDF